MEAQKRDKRSEVVMTDIEALVPKNHLLRKIERVMDYKWLYELLEPYYCHDNGRPTTDPVVLVKMMLIQYLFGIPSLRQTHREIQVNIAYRWFLGYSLLDEIPHFATDGTHIKASANKKKHVKAQVAKTSKIYPDQLRDEVNAERAELGKSEIEDDDDDDPGTKTATVSTTDPDSGLFVKGEHERQFAYEAHTACDNKSFMLGVEITAGNIHDSVAWDALYDDVTTRLSDIKFAVMDSAYKTTWIAKKILDDHRIPIVPYTRYKGKKDSFRPWEYEYDATNDCYFCPMGNTLRHTTTDRHGKRSYRSTPKNCVSCPCSERCGANEKGQKLFTRHIWQEYLDLLEQIRKTELARELYARRKETVERVFADAKEKHAMRYTHHRGLTRVATWVRLKYAAMNLKKLAVWSAKTPYFAHIFRFFPHLTPQPPLSLNENGGCLTV